MTNFKQYLFDLDEKIHFLKDLYSKPELTLSYDNLVKKEQVDYELLYIDSDSSEEKGLFVFGFNHFTSELSEEEFKDNITFESINFKIYQAYWSLKKNQNKVKVSEILSFIQDRRKDSSQVDDILKRVLSLAYYFNWKLEQDSEDIESDYLITIPESFLIRLKKRFDLTMLHSIYEDGELFMYLNSKGRINVVFKYLNTFSKKDIQDLLLPAVKKAFELEDVSFS